MQITINNILTFMRDNKKIAISEKQEQEIKDHFYKRAENLVYWSYYEDNRYFNHLFEGTITKDFYNYVQTLDKKKCYSFYSPVDNFDNVDFTIEDLKFNEDPEIIIAFLNSPNREDTILEDIIDQSE